MTLVRATILQMTELDMVLLMAYISLIDKEDPRIQTEPIPLSVNTIELTTLQPNMLD